MSDNWTIIATVAGVLGTIGAFIAIWQTSAAHHREAASQIPRITVETFGVHGAWIVIVSRARLAGKKLRIFGAPLPPPANLTWTLISAKVVKPVGIQLATKFMRREDVRLGLVIEPSGNPGSSKNFYIEAGACGASRVNRVKIQLLWRRNDHQDFYEYRWIKRPRFVPWPCHPAPREFA